MKEGMPINKETLQSVNRDINMYPQADVNDIVMLVLSAVLAFVLTGGFNGFGPGTILITFINAPLIAFFGKIIDRNFTFEPRFPKLTKMLSE